YTTLFRSRAVRANIVAAATSIVMIGGGRVGIVRRTRFGARCEDAVETLFHALPSSECKRLIVVDAGLATQERFAAATDKDALLGRLRINCTLRCAPPPPSGKRGHPAWHGPVLHPGAPAPEVEPAEALTVPGDKREVRVRRWNALHFEEARHTILDVLRIDDPAYQRPLVVGTTARELTTAEFLRAYPYRWPVETNFFVGQDTTAMEIPSAWTARALERRISPSVCDCASVTIHASGHRTVGNGAMGSEANAFGRTFSQSSRYPCDAFLDPCS